MPRAQFWSATPEACGVHSGRLHELFARAQTLVSDGEVDACSIAVCRNGQLAGAVPLGCDPQGRAVQSDSLFHMYSATKVLVVLRINTAHRQHDCLLAWLHAWLPF